MEGDRLDVWAQQFFSIAFQYGLAHALVDYPRTDPETVKTKLMKRPLVVAHT
jgi:hypothetical protein